MSTRKRILSILLAVLLVCSLLPAVAFASDDILIYNLQKQEVTLGYSGEESNIYKNFDDQGDYTIQLEDNAFFPYEVQFKYQGNTVVKTFETPDSVVKIGDHRISVVSNEGDQVGLSTLGFVVNGQYEAAKPKKKTFSSSSFSPFSLLPLNETYLTLDLSTYNEKELKTTQVSALYTALSAQPGAKLILNYYTVDGKNMKDEFRVVNPGDVVDLSRASTLEIIVGTPNQLDGNNLRYMVDIIRNEIPRFVDLEVYKQDENSTRTNVSLKYSDICIDGQEKSYRDWTGISDAYSLDDEYYLNIPDLGIYDVAFYEGDYETREAAEASGKNITSQVYAQSMTNPGAGYKGVFKDPKYFTAVFKDNAGNYIGFRRFNIYLRNSGASIRYGVLYKQANHTDFAGSYDSTLSSNTNAMDTKKCYLRAGNSLDTDYYTSIEIQNPVTFQWDNSSVLKAVYGHYDSLDAASSQTDIKGQLDDFKINFQNNSKVTVFTTHGVYKVSYEFSGYEETPGDIRTYLNVYGESTNAGVYTVSYSDDSYSEYNNFQTLLLDDENIDLSTLIPKFTVRTNTKASVAGLEQISGTSAQDFSNGPVMYTVTNNSGEGIGTYRVSFVKKAAAGTLFVNGPDKREIFLDNYYDKHHDIFIANVGATPLTGITASIINGVNVKLDEYWTVGGSGNDTLDSFSTTYVSGHYKELPNIGKVRLVANGVGPISGTLRITSANGTRDIELQGYAGNPVITTTELVEGTKYVPYSFVLETNNLHKWNKVTFEIDDPDSLPQGMKLYPNGEIYGVPLESGSFPIKVTADYSSNQFRESTVEFVLEIKDNTDDYVNARTDIGYHIIDALPRQISSVQDYVFRVNGEYGEFIDFWIDGQKLVDGVNYDSNSGSTVITIRSQTLNDFGSGTHTIAAEFRVSGDRNKDLKRSAQNYTLNIGGSGSTSSGGGGGSGRGSSIRSSRSTSAADKNPRILNKNNSATANLTGGVAIRHIVRLKNPGLITMAEFESYVEEAQKESKIPVIYADSYLKDNRVVDVRIALNPALAEKELNLSASTKNEDALKIKGIFEHFFTNKIISTVSVEQEGSFGQPVTLYVRVDKGTNVEDLVIYTYNQEANTYTKVAAANAKIDANNYLSFNVNRAQDILISNGDLNSK